jgi:hypothetical protein
MGLQELLLHFHPVVAVVVIPVAAAVALALLPYLGTEEEAGGVWFISAVGRRGAVWAALLAAIVTPVWILLDEFVVDWGGWLPMLPPLVSEGLIPTAIGTGLLLGVFRGGRRFLGASRSEALQSVFVVTLVAFLILTATGVWFRGPGMALMLPGTSG